MRVINKDTSNAVLTKLKPIVILSIKKISKKKVNNLTNFLGKNMDNNRYTTINNRVAAIKIFHQTSGGVNQAKIAQDPLVIIVINNFFIKIFFCIFILKNYFFKPIF